MPVEGYKFGLHDRVRIGGASYRVVERIHRAHLLQLVTDDLVLEPHHRTVSDEDLLDLRRRKAIRIDEGYYSRAQQVMRARRDPSDLSDLPEAVRRTIAWKVEWCTRFRRAHLGLDGGGKRIPKTPEGITTFIETNKHSINQWYVDTFGASRPPGRRVPGDGRKPFDHPGPTALRDWLDRHAESGYLEEAFRPKYHLCGRRNQIDPRALRIVEKHVPRYASRARPSKDDICRHIETDLMFLNQGLPAEARVSVSDRAIRRRINKLHSIFVEAGREGLDRTRRKYEPVGDGLVTLDGLTELDRMQRVEMDDWEMDLHATLTHEQVRHLLGERERAAMRRLRKKKVTVRCTVTVAIDVVTKCIVGLHVTPFAPSAAGSKSAIRSILVDKDPLAVLAKATSDWPMTARPLEIATDGGPAFRGDFSKALGRIGIEHRYPGQDPRSRGTIESFFRTFKRFCRLFTGQAFANVVEKGDYPAEEMASLLVEELQPFLVRHIVDDYHHRPHAGLGGMRPYEAWRRANNDLDPAPDHVQAMVAFGLHVPRRAVAADGVTFLHVRYRHPLMGTLRGQLGTDRVTIVVDPHDLGSILVRVPGPLRHTFPGEGDYLVFEAADFQGVTIAEHLRSNREYSQFEKEERLAGNPFRLGAHRDLMRAAEDARRRAGVPSDEITEEQFAKLLAAVERKGVRSVAGRAAPSGPPLEGDVGPGHLGVSVAVPVNGQPSSKAVLARDVAPRASALDGSINMLGVGDEE